MKSVLFKSTNSSRPAGVWRDTGVQKTGFNSAGSECFRRCRFHAVGFSGGKNFISDGASVRVGRQIKFPAEFIGKVGSSDDNFLSGDWNRCNIKITKSAGYALSMAASQTASAFGPCTWLTQTFGSVTSTFKLRVCAINQEKKSPSACAYQNRSFYKRIKIPSVIMPPL